VIAHAGRESARFEAMQGTLFESLLVEHEDFLEHDTIAVAFTTILRRSNDAIAGSLHVGAKTVETHVAHIFRKLGIDDAPTVNRRVAAVVALLRNPAVDIR